MTFGHAWTRTGDLGYVDSRGVVHLVGRQKEMLILADGRKVNASRVERTLLSGGLFREVCVVGLPSGGIDVVAAVVSLQGRATHHELGRVLGELADHDIPVRRLAVVDELPRNGMGKVRQGDVRAYFAETTERLIDLRSDRESLNEMVRRSRGSSGHIGRQSETLGKDACPGVADSARGQDER
jgi:acyl-CoA synthetase (AMP-forming)/AMP-acid ligase II